MIEHDFSCVVRWTGNRGTGTQNYLGYDRTWDLSGDRKAVVQCSNDPRLGGDPAKFNSEELLISALSSCHMLWYLHLANQAGIVVVAYEDEPVGIGESLPDGSGRFVSAVLRPKIKIVAGADLDKAEQIHRDVHKYCFIARSVSFPLTYAAEFEVVAASG